MGIPEDMQLVNGGGQQHIVMCAGTTPKTTDGMYKFTRFTFAEMRFAGELKGLGDVRIRTKIDGSAPTRQAGLLAMFLTRNRCGGDDFGKIGQRFHANLCCARPLF